MALIGAVLVVLYLALRVAGHYGILQNAMHKALAPKVAVYNFASYEDGRFYIVGPGITADGEMLDGDMGSNVKFCPSHSDWICLDGPIFKFAVPRHSLNVGDHWKFAGVSYTLLPSYSEVIPGGPVPGSEKPLWHYRILGREYDLYTIKAGEGDRTEIYLFSPQHGLVGYMKFEGASSKDDVRNATFWLVGEDGPGSAEFDSCISGKALLSSDEVGKLSR